MSKIKNGGFDKYGKVKSLNKGLKGQKSRSFCYVCINT